MTALRPDELTVPTQRSPPEQTGSGVSSCEEADIKRVGLGVPSGPGGAISRGDMHRPALMAKERAFGRTCDFSESMGLGPVVAGETTQLRTIIRKPLKLHP